MSSSDSEEGFYGNAALKLQKLKNTHREDNIYLTANISSDTDDSLNNILKTKGKRRSTRNKSKSIFKKPKPAPVELSEDDIINDLLGITRRVTRSSSRSNSDVSTHSNDYVSQTRKAPAKKTGRGRGRGKGRSANRSSNQNTQNTNNGRGRSRRQTQEPDIPTYSIGNTDEYPDELDNQALFSKSNDIVILDNDSQEDEDKEDYDDNEELSVKIYWQSSEIFTFNIRKYQKLAQIFEHFAKKENIGHDKLLFTFNDRIIKPEDTPDTIDYNIAKFIDGGIVKQSVSHLLKNTDNITDKEVKNGIKIKFQCENMKKPLELTIGIDDTLSLTMLKCAEHMEKPLEKLKFKFDGDIISGKKTPRELELEGGECIDVKIIS